MRALILLLALPMARNALEPVQTEHLAAILSYEEEIAHITIGSESAYNVRVYRVPTEIGECGGAIGTCPDVDLFITVSYGDLYETPRLFRLPSSKGWEFVAWVKCPSTSDSPQTGFQVRTTLPEANVDSGERARWVPTDYDVCVGMKSGSYAAGRSGGDMLLATQPASAVRIAFDFDCARAEPPPSCEFVLPTAEEAREAGAWNDRAVPVDLDGDHHLEYIAPIQCGATGNCEWLILEEENCIVLGRLSGAFITVTRGTGEKWSRIEGYSTQGAGHGVLVRYIWEDGAYREASTIELVDPDASDYLAAIGKISCPAE